MKITRIIAVSIILSSFGVTVLQAQTFSKSGPPAEFPPASFKGKQYIDSQGCVFIRAGIDGNVTWVPRVSRSRKQLCGYTPSAVAGATSTQTQSGPAPVQITLPASSQPAATPVPTRTSPTATVASTTAPTATARTKPRRTPTPAPAARPAAVIVAAPSQPTRPVAPAAVAAPTARTTVPVAPSQGGCANASALSQRYINKGARCGPQAESPITYGSGSGPQSSLLLSPNTRVVPVHVYQNRRLSADLEAPTGYRTVWSDDRLNPHRAERGLKPAVVRSLVEVPSGFVPVTRDDDRFNSQRAVRTAAGDAQSDLIWNRKVPRTLVQLPLDRQVISLPRSTARSQAEAEDPLVLRLSTRSAPKPATAAIQRRYVRAATFADPRQAQQAAQGLAARGLPVRLGTVTRKGQAYRVVLAGPFGDDSRATAALQQVRAAGYSGARLSK